MSLSKKKVVKPSSSPVANEGLSLADAIRKAGRFGAIRNEKFVRLDFDKNGHPYHLYDGRWMRPHGRSFSDEAVVTMGWEAVEDAASIPVSMVVTWKSDATVPPSTFEWALAT